MKEVYKEIVEKTLEMCKATLLSKNEEYSSQTNPFHNFDVAAKLQDTTSIRALAGMMAKHTASIYDMCMNENSEENKDIEKWNEKIIDHINYLIILRAIRVAMDY